MDSIDDRLTGGLHELAGTVTDSAPPTGQLISRGRRARRQRTALAFGASFALAALGAGAAVAVAATPPHGPGERPQAGASASPAPAEARLELVAALTNSQHVSFRVTTTAGPAGGGASPGPSGAAVTESAFDPATTSGYIRFTGSRYEVRLVRGVLYQTNGKDFQWWRQPGRHQSLNMDEHPVRGAFMQSGDAGWLLRELREGDAEVTRTGPHTYRFKATVRAEQTFEFAGDIVIGADRRIAEARYTWGPAGGAERTAVTMRYSGYGEPVTVEVPQGAVAVG